jgi:biofilm PGA synthesis N-glycosyltransferase PgaC
MGLIHLDPLVPSPSRAGVDVLAPVQKTVPGRRYCLITPCRDEAAYASRTIESVARQTLPPALWVVVDDGSKDETPAIVEGWAARLPYLRLIRRSDRGGRKVGPGVIEAFNVGYASIDPDDFDYICKMDLDLDLPPGYFEGLVQRMEAEPRLGTTSGKPFFINPRTGNLEPELCGDEMSVGMTKFYRRTCFAEIGGFVEQVMWDGIDCHRARMLGWLAESVDEPSLRFVHLRPQGASHQGLWTGRTRAGFGQYFMGTAPLYHSASAAYRVLEHPRFIGSVAMLWGYWRSAALRLPRYDDPVFRSFLRRYQYSCLLMGKSAATARLNDSQAPLWHAAHSPHQPAEQQAPVKPARSELFGLEFEAARTSAIVDRCRDWCAGPRATHIVLTANASHLCLMRRDASLRHACERADVTVADGMSVVWALRLLGRPVPERVTGIDLMVALLDLASANGLRVYFLGARPDVLETVVAECALRFPGLIVAGARHGYFTGDDHEAIVEEIRESQPHLLFVGMPSPAKDVFCQRYRDRLQVPVVMGVGGSFDVLAGFIRRAPRALQTLGLEWTWRLLMEPRKLWKRYLTTNTEFIWLVLRELMLGRSNPERVSHPR